MKKDINNIELRSEEVQDILERPPHILVRAGISVICGMILLFFISSFFFKYPDIIEGSVSITTENPSIWLVSKANGKIKELYCSDKQEITKGQLIAVIENPTLTSDAEILRQELKNCIITDSIVSIPSKLYSHFFELGEIQSSFSTFIRAVIDYNNFILLSQIEQDKKSLKAQIAGKNDYRSSVTQQINIKEKEFEIAKTSFERENQLFDKGVISKADLELAERNLLTIQESLTQLRSILLSDQVEIIQLNQTLSKYDIQYLSEKNKLFSVLVSSFHELNSVFQNWEQTYLLKATDNGILNFNKVWSKDQFVKSGENVFAVIPLNHGGVIGRITIPSIGAGKIETGQLVNIKVFDYPYMEYGFLQGKVKSISMVPDENNYMVEVRLINNLITTTNKELNFRGELLGQAEIMTDDISLAERIISPLKTLLKKYKT